MENADTSNVITDDKPECSKEHRNCDVDNKHDVDVTASQLPPAYPSLFAAADGLDAGPVSRDSSAGRRTEECAGNSVDRGQHPRNANNNIIITTTTAPANSNDNGGCDVDGGVVVSALASRSAVVERLDLSGGSGSSREVTPRDVSLEGEGEATGGRGTKTLRFNIGGTLFQTKEATIDKQTWRAKGIKLANRDFLSRFYDEDQDEYFMDRDPEVFNSVLNLLRSGRLHIPSSMCGQHAKEELQFWGVSPLQVEPCCWSKLNSWNATRENLKLLEHDVLNIRGTPRGNNSRCSRCRIVVWRTLTNPAYSLLAKIYGWISFIFVLAAIFSFCASTHPTFRVPITGQQPLVAYDLANTRNNSTTTASSTPNSTTTTTPLPPTTPMYKTVSQRLKETEVHPALQYLDYLCLAFFTLEYLVKLITSPRKLRFLRSFKGIIDLLAIAPDYVEIILLIMDPDALTEKSFVVLFMPFLRVARAFRIFRLFRHLPGLWIMVYTIQSSYKDLFLMFAFLMVGTLLFASLVFFIDDKETFTSIPHGFWWAIVTMTTVGYGDMYPVTAPGYVLGSVTAISGVLMIGFTIPALVNNFILYYEHVQFVRERAKLTKEFEDEEKAKRDQEEKRAREEEEEERRLKEEGRLKRVNEEDEEREKDRMKENASGKTGAETHETAKDTDRTMTEMMKHRSCAFQGDRYTKLDV